MKKIQMARAIEVWPVERLQPYERNARTHSPEQIAKLAASILEFGFTNPVLVDSSDGIIAGHGRLAAAKHVGLAEVPVVVLDHLSDEQRRAYILADNRLALDAGWDHDVLREELAALEAVDFDLALTGFTEAELDALGGEDLEDLGADGDESASGVTAAKLTFGDHKLEITADELALLEGKLAWYTEHYGSTFGFATWLAQEGGADA